jgi:hypothetical protein
VGPPLSSTQQAPTASQEAIALVFRHRPGWFASVFYLRWQKYRSYHHPHSGGLSSWVRCLAPFKPPRACAQHWPPAPPASGREKHSTHTRRFPCDSECVHNQNLTSNDRTNSAGQNLLRANHQCPVKPLFEKITTHANVHRSFFNGDSASTKPCISVD